MLAQHDFVFGRVHILADALGWTQSLSDPPQPNLPAQDRSAVFSHLDQQIKDLTSALPPATALIVYTGCSDPRPTGHLNRRKTAWEEKVKSGIMNDAMPAEERWFPEDIERLDRECEKTKAGLAFFCVALGAPRSLS
jgi:RNA exonuclease 1